MDFQLVLQFQGDSLGDFDVLIALEEKLIEALENDAEVDGHDFGSGEANIFILTSNPESTFQAAKPVLLKCKLIENVIAAYRDVNGEDYTVIWPRGFD